WSSRRLRHTAPVSEKRRPTLDTARGSLFFFFNDAATTEIYTLSLHDALPISWIGFGLLWGVAALTNPSALSFLPFAGCWLVYQLHRRGKRYVVPALLS